MSALDRLAEAMGIEPEFTSATGELRRPSQEVKRALLAAMGVPAGNDAEAADALRDVERQRWAEPLAPRVLAAPARDAAVPCTLPAGTRRLRWSVREESGGTRGGEASFADLELDAARDGFERRRLRIPAELPLGYHELHIEGGAVAAAALIVAPRRCYVPSEALADDGPSVWGVALQLYALRSARNFGIGDFTDLREAVHVAARLGADVVGVNPLHALFPDEPEHASPYSPASRLFLDVLYIDPTAVPELAAAADARRMLESPETARIIEECRRAPLVDYARVAALKLALLERLFAAFEAGASDERRQRFAEFRRRGGEALERYCRFQTLREHHKGTAPELADWRRWPAEHRDCTSSAVARLAKDHRRRVTFHAWTQWLADEQLEAAAEAAREERMRIGLYRDVAVGADLSGAEAWSSPELFVQGASAGAPPDALNLAGQDWGLPPLSPHALRRQGYAGFAEILRANMRAAGAVRIDHAMALQRLYWIPAGHPPTEGAYVRYPLEDLLGILALESSRRRCIVVGEDLGTVPEGFRERMHAAGVFSYRVLSFERDAERLHPPGAYPRLALATFGSHDLATLRGWWEGRDIALKTEKELYPSAATAAAQRAERAAERRMLIDALRREGIAVARDMTADSPYDPALARAVHELLARTRAWLAMAQLEDLVDAGDQANVPGTVHEYPNWRRKIDVPLEALAADDRVQALTGILRRLRPRATGA